MRISISAHSQGIDRHVASSFFTDMKVLVTGSSRLIGWEAVLWFDQQRHTMVGVTTNMRSDFFEPGRLTYSLDQILDALVRG